MISERVKYHHLLLNLITHQFWSANSDEFLRDQEEPFSKRILAKRQRCHFIYFFKNWTFSLFLKLTRSSIFFIFKYFTDIEEYPKDSFVSGHLFLFLKLRELRDLRDVVTLHQHSLKQCKHRLVLQERANAQLNQNFRSLVHSLSEKVTSISFSSTHEKKLLFFFFCAINKMLINSKILTKLIWNCSVKKSPCLTEQFVKMRVYQTTVRKVIFCWVWHYIRNVWWRQCWRFPILLWCRCSDNI